LTIIVYASGKPQDLFSTVISVYKAMDSNVKDLNRRDKGGEVNFKLNTLLLLTKLSSEQLKLLKEKLEHPSVYVTKNIASFHTEHDPFYTSSVRKKSYGLNLSNFFSSTHSFSTSLTINPDKKKIKFIKPGGDNCFIDEDTKIEYVRVFGK
jgi:hypothetical protein